MRLAHVAFLVRDYDEAITWFTDALGFDLVEDTPLDGTKRWVVVRPPGGGAGLLLARADGPEQEAHVGHQHGGRVGWFLEVEDFAAAHGRMAAAGVVFLEAPRHEPYATVAVFQDLYGGRWDLLEPVS